MKESRQPLGQMSIGMLARLTGFNVSAIRYYEEVGLIPQAARRPSGHRAYTAEVRDLLALIRRCREFGFSIDETRALVTLSSSEARDCAEAKGIAQRHLDAVRLKLAELQRLECLLGEYVRTCASQCAGGPAPRCAIFRDLVDAKAPCTKNCRG